MPIGPKPGCPVARRSSTRSSGTVDAIEIDARDRTAAFLPMWYRLLNAGVRLPLVGGSGKDSNRIALGGVRTLTPAGRDLCANGSNTSGPAGRLPRTGRSCDSTRPCDGFTAEAASVVPFERLEIVANGKVIASAVTTIGDVTTATVSVEPDSDGGWVAARCLGTAKSELYPHVPVFAHTSAVFVGSESRQPAAVAALQRDIEGVRDWVESSGRFAIPKRKEALLALCDAALAQLGLV